MSDAVAAVFHEEAGRLTAALVKRLGDFDLAEECVQDALVAALEDVFVALAGRRL